MTKVKALDGKPHAGNPNAASLQRHGVTIRFDDGEVALSATPRLGAVLLKAIRVISLSLFASLFLFGEVEALAAGDQGAPSIIDVEEGTYTPTFENSGTNLVGSLTVKSGARLVIPEGIVLVSDSILVEDGSIFGGYGRLVCSSLSDAALRGLVLEDGVSVDDGRSGDEFSIEVLSGTPGMGAQDGDSVWIFDTNATIRVNGAGVFDVLLVGGGGGGGSKNGGGGGGGGVVYTQRLAVASGVYSVAVGLGGKGAPNKSTNDTSGGDSGVFGLAACGGGAGGTYSRGTTGRTGVPFSGGSGGGSGAWYPDSGNTGRRSGADGVDGQGFAGGSSTNGTSFWVCAGGGGGGAGSPGVDAYYEKGEKKMRGGNGGSGVLCEIYGSKRYGGGGGGGASPWGDSASSFRGCDGGGDGGVTVNSSLRRGQDGTDGLGGGGGGGSGYDAESEGGAGGDGGSGVVILRWRQPAPSEKYLPDGYLAVGGIVKRKNGYAIHKFDSDGAFALSASTLVDVLLVGGGGGGGSRSGGGGGGGGVVVVSNAYLLAGSYDVTVGVGGTGAAGTSGANGTDSVLSCGLRAVGGGGGGYGNAYTGQAGGSGGGGGAPYVSAATLTVSGGVGTDGQGHAGGGATHVMNSYVTAQGGGGGGAGANGEDATTSLPGNGGDGIVCDFSGEPLYYGGGGGGGSATSSHEAPTYYTSLGGLGGGGRGGSAYEPYPKVSVGENGTDGFGGGGGGGGGAVDAAAVGGKGGNGVVIIRYRVRRNGSILIVY